jgi:uncharacterized paraquat-inducible protein A
MDRYTIESGRRAPARRAGCITLAVAALILLAFAKSFASYAIEVKWWQELGQFNTWLKMLYYGLAPLAAATVLAFAALFLTHARALKFAGTGDRRASPLHAHLHVRPAAARV